ncbi:unnamed protein product [Tuber aestivum]|uniref:Mid2 domain-containing protein n=1 Tax=Tuber aestivum TaxID=59557 RepID=A0A292PI18_9PEZI|nr:unnamed protein product [Tuber aestivum]
MSISKKLRLAYVAEWLLAVSISALPIEQSPVVEGADESVAVMLGKRERKHGSLGRVIDEVAGRNYDVFAQRGERDEDEDSDGDGKSEGGDSDGSVDSEGTSVGRDPRGGTHAGNTTLGWNPAEQAGSSPAKVEGQQGASTVAKNLLIAGGAIAAFIFVALIAFWLYKARGRIFRRANFKRGTAHRFRGGGIAYDEKSSVYPQSTIFSSGSNTRPILERKYSIPGIPFPPPALALPDTSPGRHRSREHLLIRTSLLREKRPVSSPYPVDEKGTFYDGASDADPSSPQQEDLPLPPPVYSYMTDHPLLSPSQSSSISNIKPRKPPRTATTTNNRPQSYAQIYPPPPIPESNTIPRNAPQMDSRFSWTTTVTSEAPSDVKSVRSSLNSEPMFRGVNSWVSHQAGKLERKERLAQLQLEQHEEEQAQDIPLGSPPATPNAFRHHPGAPVSFLEHRARMEAAMEAGGRFPGLGR